MHCYLMATRRSRAALLGGAPPSGISIFFARSLCFKTNPFFHFLLAGFLAALLPVWYLFLCPYLSKATQEKSSISAMLRCAYLVAGLAIALGVFHNYTHIWYPITRATPAPSINWDRTVSLATTEHTVVRPKFLYEVQELVRDAASKRRKVKVIGAGHSWSTIAA